MSIPSLLHAHRTLVRTTLFATAVVLVAACSDRTPTAPTSATAAKSSPNAMLVQKPDTTKPKQDTTKKTYPLTGPDGKPCGTITLTYVLGPNGGTWITTINGKPGTIEGELGVTYVNDSNPINISRPITGGTYDPTTGITTTKDTVSTKPYPTTNIWINWIDVTWPDGTKCSYDKLTSPAPTTPTKPAMPKTDTASVKQD